MTTCIRPYKLCLFFNRKLNQCTFVGNTCYPIVEKCLGCSNIETYNDIQYCISYMHPEKLWSFQTCPRATHIKPPEKVKQKPMSSKKAAKKYAKSHKAAI